MKVIPKNTFGDYQYLINKWESLPDFIDKTLFIHIIMRKVSMI